ncbi:MULTISPECIES: PucR family transcriptional regulator [unclassified Cytobacillus]|uniref:PucR family transcriptional regulator n=1 Tax=unclassified Cytobacillus TaxID=2675268 RepID=UPI00135C4549|nr:helix-turn-helix domain-containing protein [Cytobacillus sp. AMY 15.2]KAF0820525.1 Regulator of polyketide synthase expression [Bacillus sp. ZZV12-4809]MCM3090418.1 helix-turn-helix domain-containing protein [Cytobacillus sp. AMY 15.2]
MSQPLEKILSLTDIDEITEMVSTFLKKPVVIEDEQFSLLAYSSYYIEHFDLANQQTIFSKRWPIPILEKFMDEGIVDQLKTISEPFRIKKMEEIGLNQRAVVSAKYKDQILGFIWVQELDGCLSESDMKFLHDVSFHIGKLLYQENLKKLRKEEEKHQFYQKIIDRTYQTEDQIKWEAANVKIILPEAFIINVFTVVQGDEELFAELSETVRLFANALSHPSHIFTNQHEIIVMIGSSSPAPGSLSEDAHELTNTVLSQFRQQTVYAGIGGEYASILKLRKSYREALEVIKAAKFIGSPEELPYEYKKLWVFRYLEPIAQHNSQTNYVNEDLMKLQKKDLESQTSLLKTLEVYLLNNCRLKPTAEQLFIHTNTLKYRMKQITDLTSIDFDDFNTRCQLYIDLQLLKRKK